jgi:hypothetical protein
MSAKSVEAPRGQWWSIPQAIVWIVGRDLALTTRAGSIVEIDALENWEEMPARPATPPTGDPPISRIIAPGELVRAAVAGRIEIRGHHQGTGESQPIPVQSMRRPALRDDIYGPAIVDDFWGAAGAHDVWRGLWIDADQCTAQWPGGRESSRRDAGAKPTKRQTLKTWLLGTFPNGIIPPTTKNATALADFFEATGVNADEKTLRRASMEIKQENSGQNPDR